MGSVRPGSRAVVLSSTDLDGCPAALLHSCEDCACEVSGGAATLLSEEPLAAAAATTWIRGPEIVEVPLTARYLLLFNPLSTGGAVVLNDVATAIYKGFTARPATFDQVRGKLDGSALGEFDEVSARLRALGLIEPFENPVRLGFLEGDSDGELLTAWLHLTNDCGLRCPYCYLHKSSDRMDETTGVAAVEAVVRSAVDHGLGGVKLKYAGGEATMNRPVMLAIHEHARQLTAAHGLEFRATLLTNGVALPADLIATLRAERIGVMISLDGVGDHHDAQRPSVGGKPSFHQVERTIARLIEQGHRPHLSVTVTKLNAAGLPDVVRFALDHDLTFSLNFFRDSEFATGYEDLRCPEPAMITAMLAAFAVVEEFLPPWSVLGTVLDRGQLVRPRQYSCGVAGNYVVIDQRGQVAACHMEIERTLGDVFGDDPLALVRKARGSAGNLPVEQKEGCRDCAWRYWCSGGCSVATYRATGRFDVKSPNCGIYQALYPEALRLEGLRILKYGLPTTI